MASASTMVCPCNSRELSSYNSSNVEKNTKEHPEIELINKTISNSKQACDVQNKSLFDFIRNYLDLYSAICRIYVFQRIHTHMIWIWLTIIYDMCMIISKKYININKLYIQLVGLHDSDFSKSIYYLLRILHGVVPPQLTWCTKPRRRFSMACNNSSSRAYPWHSTVT